MTVQTSNVEAGTLDHVFEMIWRAMPETTRHGGKCPTLLCWHALKTWLSAREQTGRLVPGTVLTELDGFFYDDMKRDLRRQGWHMPERRYQSETWIVAVLLTLGLSLGFLPLLGAYLLVIAPICLACAVRWLHRNVFRSSLPDAASVGELARHMCVLQNARKLRKMGATFNRRNLRALFDKAAAELDVD